MWVWLLLAYLVGIATVVIPVAIGVVRAQYKGQHTISKMDINSAYPQLLNERYTTDNEHKDGQV